MCYDPQFARLLGLDAPLDDNESVHNNTPTPDIDCEGIFDKENPLVVDDDGDELMGLDCNKNRVATLKKLGNSKHKPINGNAFIDGFESGRVQLSDVTTERKKQIEKEQQEEVRIRMAVNYFISESEKRRKVMNEQIEKEISGTMLSCQKDDWELDYLEYKKEMDDK